MEHRVFIGGHRIIYDGCSKIFIFVQNTTVKSQLIKWHKHGLNEASLCGLYRDGLMCELIIFFTITLKNNTLYHTIMIYMKGSRATLDFFLYTLGWL